MNYNILFLVLFCVLTVFAHEKIKLTEIQALTLHYGRMTSGRRSSPVPQLECIGGSAGCKDNYIPRVVQCKNMGSDGFDVQWKCQADMASNLRFGKLDVNCEGYDYPQDKYVLKGSCGLRYSLDISGKTGEYETYESKTNYNTTNGIYFFLICIIVCALIYFFCLAPSNNPHYGPTPDSAPNFGSAPPPPPGFRPEYTEPPPYESVQRDKYNPPPAAGTNDGPGFWTGLGTGGLLGYLFGSRTTNQTPYYTERAHYSQPHTAWFDSGSRHTARHHDSDAHDTSTFRTATGFSGTSRR